MTSSADPKCTALLVMDYQPGILARLPNATGLIERTRNAITQAREAGVQIGYVRVAFTAQDYAAIPSRNKSFARLAGGGSMLDGLPETDVHPELAPIDGDIVVTKTRVSAFSTTKLAHLLGAHGIDTLVLAGLSTGGVVLSTLGDAADRDYRLFVLSDCCDDPHPETHRVLMDHVFPRRADVIESSALSSIFGRFTAAAGGTGSGRPSKGSS